MPSKMQYISALADQTLDSLTASAGDWTKFLNSAAWLYKYPFQDQVMIYSQRPDATACAEMELWNTKMGRRVLPRAKGIALIDDSGNYPTLKYVFDVSDTAPSYYRGKDVKLWEMQQEHKSLVLSALAKNYEDIDTDDSSAGNDTLADAFRNIANQLTKEYYSDNHREILFRSENSFLEPPVHYDFAGSAIEDADDSALSAAFEEMITNSVAYILMARCGLDPSGYFDSEDFRAVADFNTPDMANALGVASSSLSEQVLRDIEITIRKYERARLNNLRVNTGETERSENSHDRNSNLHRGRGLSPARPETERTAEGADAALGQVRANEENIPQRTQTDNVQPSVTIGESVPPSEGSGRSGGGTALAGDEPPDRIEPAAEQSGRPDGLDGAHERIESPSGGDDSPRTGLQLDEGEPPPTFSALGKSSQTPKPIPIAELLRGSAVSLPEVDSILRDGGNFYNRYLLAMPFQSRSPLRIAAYFSKGLDNNVDYLKREYLAGQRGRGFPQSGKGFDFGNHRVCTWFDEDGITLAIGKTAKNNIHRVTIPWESAAARIDELMREGRYISRSAFDNAIENERLELASRLWFFYRDDTREIPEDFRAESGGYPSDHALIKSLLENGSERQRILERLETDVETWRNNPERRSWGNPERLLSDMRNAMHPPVIFPNGDYTHTQTYSYFITQDEIDTLLMHGGNYTEGKLRFMSFFLGGHSEKEKIDFVKREYGHGGGTWSQTDGWQNATPGGGLNLQRGGSMGNPAAEVTLKWNAVIKRIEQLISEGRYMTRSELDRASAYERLILVRRVDNFFYDLPEEYERPFHSKTWQNYSNTSREAMEKLLDFNYPREAEWEAIRNLLDNPENVDALLERMGYIFENTPEDDRHYDTRKAGLEALTAYRDGTYTLFPGIEKLPDPETAMARRITPPAVRGREMVEDLRELSSIDFRETEPQSGEQMGMFDFGGGFPVLPNQDEQQALIERHFQEKPAEQEIANNERVSSTPYAVQGENNTVDSDAPLLDISDEDKTRIIEQFADNPRSREAVNLIRGIYGDTLGMPLPQAVKRIAELVENGAFAPSSEPQEPAKRAYAEGDTVWVENRRFSIESIGGHYKQPDDLDRRFNTFGRNINLTDLTSGYPIGRVMYQAELDYKLGLDERNAHLLPLGEEPDAEPATAKQETEQVVDTSAEAPAEMPVEPETPAEPEAPQYDFDVIAEEIYEQVLNDSEFAEALASATSRGALRRPLNAALDAVIAGYESEQAMYDYLSNDDTADSLFDFIYRKAWDERPQPETIVPEQPVQIETAADGDAPLPIADLLYEEESPTSDEVTAYYLLQYPNSINAGAVLDNDTLALITEKADTYVICAEASFLSASDMERFNIGFRKMPRDWNLLPEAVQEQIRGIKPEYEKQWLDYTQHERDFEQWQNEQQKIETKTVSIPNFRITDDNLGEGGAKTKFRNNILALQTLKTVESERRAARPEEQETLSRYVGWGGVQQAFDPDNTQWTNEYLELNALLTPEEWESAKASTLNAHFTSPVVIRAMWDTVARMGFKSGNILEPALGTGNFFGMLPDSMRDSKLYGVELDSVTARIAKHLYPDANIQETGFEKTQHSDAFFDIAIGNVPFGGFGVVDKRYKTNFNIHDYFFQKSLDKVRPGGIIAFITSKGTLDKQNPEVRKYIAQRAELLGAVRLPNTAFKANAGTEATTDIIFLQKRDRPVDIEPDWIHLGLTEDNIPINRYFLDNPEMLLGTMTRDSGTRMYGSENSTTCVPFEGADLAEQLRAALLNIQGEITEPELDDLEGVDNHAIPADPNVKNFSYTLVDEGLYFRENSLMYPVDLPSMTQNRIRGMLGLRECVNRLIELQLHDYSDAEIKAQQAELNTLYDNFTAEFGLISSQANSRAFNADSSYYLLSSLEVLDEDGELLRKADMFTKRTIKQYREITSVDTSSEALAVSIAQRAQADMDFMCRLTGFTEEKIASDLQGVIFKDPKSHGLDKPNYLTADEYLSGNVREKLKAAREYAEKDSIFEINVKALEAIQPKDLEAGEIGVRLGATWIDPKYIQQFMYELLDTSWHNQKIYQVHYHNITGEWQVAGKGRSQFSDIPSTVTYGTSRMNAYQILNDTLNLRDVRVYDYKEDADGREKRVLNKKETMLAQQKQEMIKQKFRDWIWEDPERRRTLVRVYNDMFNSIRPREFDGSHITFVGINPEIKLGKHQIDGAARQLYGGNTLYAHVVGAGKTFTMIASAMESKRLGLCNKSLFAVPNHLTEQWATEFLRLYPSANILVATKRDFEMRNRKKFCAKIATGEYDAVIIGHTQLEKIPMSRERQERQMREQILEIEAGIRELKHSRGERFTIKQLEKTKKGLDNRLKKLLDSKKRDDVVTFEQLGVDRLFVDEAHGFKDLYCNRCFKYEHQQNMCNCLFAVHSGTLQTQRKEGRQQSNITPTFYHTRASPFNTQNCDWLRMGLRERRTPCPKSPILKWAITFCQTLN